LHGFLRTGVARSTDTSRNASSRSDSRAPNDQPSASAQQSRRSRSTGKIWQDSRQKQRQQKQSGKESSLFPQSISAGTVARRKSATFHSSATGDNQVFAPIQESRFAVTDGLAGREEGFVRGNFALFGWTRVAEESGVVSERGVVLLLFVVDFAEEEGAAGEDRVATGDVALDAAGGRVMGWGPCRV
jgi:hypothetical protein